MSFRFSSQKHSSLPSGLQSNAVCIELDLRLMQIDALPIVAIDSLYRLFAGVHVKSRDA